MDSITFVGAAETVSLSRKLYLLRLLLLLILVVLLGWKLDSSVHNICIM